MPAIRNAVVAALMFLGWNGLSAQDQTRTTVRRISSLPPDMDLELLVMEHTLADAPITKQERDSIYSLIDTPSIHDGYDNEHRDQERTDVLSAHVGLVSLAQDGKQQILVRWPPMLCGATGNCDFAIFERQRGTPKLIMLSEGWVPAVTGSFHLGYPDLFVGFHISAGEHSEVTYRWSGEAYGPAESRHLK